MWRKEKPFCSHWWRKNRLKVGSDVFALERWSRSYYRSHDSKKKTSLKMLWFEFSASASLLAGSHSTGTCSYYSKPYSLFTLHSVTWSGVCCLATSVCIWCHSTGSLLCFHPSTSECKLFTPASLRQAAPLNATRHTLVTHMSCVLPVLPWKHCLASSDYS